jgi:hypothetical protein
MSNFTPIQVYEHVPFHYMVPDHVLIIGTFACPGGHSVGIPVELRITSPLLAAGTWNATTVAIYPTVDTIAYVTFWLPLWRPTVCGEEITYEVRGNCGGFTPWETLTAVVGPRSDEHRTWLRKLDGDMHVPPSQYQPLKRWYPATLNQLLWCVRNHQQKFGPVLEARATGSHWGISYTSVTPGEMFETSTPVHEKDGDQTAARLNNVLYDVIPSCLTQDAWAHFKRQQVHVFNPKLDVIEEQNYLFHVEAGMRIYELYSYIDAETDGQNPRSLAAAIEDSTHASTVAAPGDWPCYLGPWAVETMGGAGGQTIVGVASTATHGGDINSSTISDLVVAMHLIAPDGQEYWIERTHIRPSTIPLKLIDETLLRKAYPVGDPSAPGGAQRRTDILYRQDDDLLNAALVSCGRMGIIYSVVLRAIRQFALDQNTSNSEWKDVKKWICNPADPTFISVFKNRFVRIDVDLYPQPEFDWHTAAYTFAGLVFAGPIGALAGLLIGLKGDKYRTWQITRTMVPLQNAGDPPYGRAERGGSAAGNNPDLKAPDPSPSPLKGCFSDPCGSANWVRQFLTDSIGDLSDVRDDAIKGWLAAGAAMALFPPNAVWAEPLQAFLTRVIVFTEYWIIVFSEIRAILPDEAMFGDFLCAVMNVFGGMHAHSIVQLLYSLGQNSQHQATDKKYVAISYGVMDEHNYQNKGCVAPGDSIELFFDADKTDFRDFVDFVLGAVRDLADDGKVWAGYLSMRFMTQSSSLLAMQQWPRTVSMEIASLSKASGAESLMSRIEEEARTRGIILHWGQRNRQEQKDIEKRFSLSKWRDRLSDLSEHGRLANLSTEFTRLKGLEITVPRVYGLTASLSDGCAGEMTRIDYDGWKNPPGTTLTLVQRFASGVVKWVDLPNLLGSIDIPLGPGRSTLELHAARSLNGNVYHATPLQTSLHGLQTGDVWQFKIETELRMIGGMQRWFAEINLWSMYISNLLRVSEVGLEATNVSNWIMRNAETGDVSFAGLADSHALAMLPLFNTNWQFFSAAAVSATSPPTLTLAFKISC